MTKRQAKQKQTAYSRALAKVRKYFPEVTEVKDATEGVDVSVTPKDSREARRKDHKDCAMAVACHRALAVDGVIMSIATAYLIKGDVATRYSVPESVSREVVSFDRGAGFAEGSYKLSKPDRPLGEGQPHGGTNETSRPKRSHAGKTAVARHYTSNIRSVLGSDVER